MGRPPAVVIVARHGARLDAADKQWHLTSPTPYDPPLTYGGWTQCRALGARIASLLEAREKLSEPTENGEGPQDSPANNPSGQSSGDGPHVSQKRPPGNKKKHKIIIHSSPFLRCIQTSVAVSAGISQYRGQHESTVTEKPAKKSAVSLDLPPKSNPSFSVSPNLTAIPDEELRPTPHAEAGKPSQWNFKPKLRVDAFLGEWLSPDYYENITPPPGSVMMIAGAKAELLRRGDHIENDDDGPSKVASAQGNFPGGWGSLSGPGTPEMKPEDKMVDDVSKLALRSPRRDRSSTVSSNGSLRPREDVHTLRLSTTSSGYVPPVPHYAVSPSDHIPNGYVQHARDACIEVDYQWDSMRPPQNWGDGGDYGEEWSNMHKRFRKGLHRMIDWYRLHHETANQVGGHQRVLHPHPREEDDPNTDTVLILVTHGAGSNALIGALTDQPVLMDVSMASLTMAIRRDDESRPSSSHAKLSPTSPTSPTSPQFRQALDRPLSADYKVQLTASTDHLRAASSSQPLAIPLLNNTSTHSPHSSQSSITSAPGPRVAPRRSRMDSLSSRTIEHTSSPFSPIEPAYKGGLHRSASATSRPERSNSGLWSRPSEEAPKRTWTLGQADGAAEQAKFKTSNGGMWGGGGSAISSGTQTPVGQRTPERKEPASNGLGNFGMWGSTGVSGSAISSGTETPVGDDSTPGCANGTWSWNRPMSPVSAPTFPGAPPPKSGDFGAAGLWGGNGLSKSGMSSMAMALRSEGLGTKQEHRGNEEEGEKRERELGSKRRWTMSEGGEVFG